MKEIAFAYLAELLMSVFEAISKSVIITITPVEIILGEMPFSWKVKPLQIITNAVLIQGMISLWGRIEHNGAMQGTHLYILYHFQTKITSTSSFSRAMDFITHSHLYWCTFGNTLIQYNLCLIHRKIYWNFNILYACAFWFKSRMYFSYDCGRYGIEMRALCFMCQWNVHMVLNKPAWAGYVKNWAI